MNDKNEPRTASSENAEACSRDCQESSALCTWPNCSCPMARQAEPIGNLFPTLVKAA